MSFGHRNELRAYYQRKHNEEVGRTVRGAVVLVASMVILYLLLGVN